jgi:hypothetical protein
MCLLTESDICPEENENEKKFFKESVQINDEVYLCYPKVLNPHREMIYRLKKLFLPPEFIL